MGNSYPTSIFKTPNIDIVDLDFVYKQLLDGCEACKTTLNILDTMSKRKIDRTCKNFIPQLLELQYCSTVTMVKTSTWYLSENTQDACTEMHASTMLIL